MDEEEFLITNDKIEIDKYIKCYWGHSTHIITKKEIYELLSGKSLLFNDGEYSHLLKLKDVEQPNSIAPLDNIMSCQEAAELWNLNPDYIRELCNKGKIKAKNIGKTWIIDKNQPNPKKY